MSPRTTTLRVILLHLIHYFFSFTSVRAQLLNVTVSPTRATFSGSWTCGVDGKGTTAFGSVGDTLRIAFEGRLADDAHDLTSSIVIGIGLDGSQTRIHRRTHRTRVLQRRACRRRPRSLSPSCDQPNDSRCCPGRAFIFGGMTATIDQSASSLTGNSTSNVPGKQPASPSEGDEHIGLIIGVIGVRRVRRSEMAQFQQMAIMTLDNSQAQTRTTVEPPTGQRGGASVPIRQLDGAQVIRATSSVSSYPATVDVPFPSGFVPVAPPPLPRSTAAAALDPLQVAQAKAGVNRARSGKRVHYRKRTLDNNEAGGTSAGGGSSAGGTTP
ncbi:hypothetical protein BKA62DRAFT_729475, partial [Auriculariales sp. MPI-PUGE-AT-0066]